MLVELVELGISRFRRRAGLSLGGNQKFDVIPVEGFVQKGLRCLDIPPRSCEVRHETWKAKVYLSEGPLKVFDVAVGWIKANHQVLRVKFQPPLINPSTYQIPANRPQASKGRSFQRRSLHHVHRIYLISGGHCLCLRRPAFQPRQVTTLHSGRALSPLAEAGG